MTLHLSIMLFWPLALAALAALAPRRLAGPLAVVGALVPLGYAVTMLVDFDRSARGLQYVTDDAWIESLGIRYSLGVDGLNLWLIALATVLFTATALWIALRPPAARPRLFAFHVLLAETAVLGALVAQDLALFILFFDLMLLPIYFLIGQWGEGNRVAATIKLVIYTLAGSLLMLAAAVAAAVLAGQATGEGLTFSLAELRQIDLSPGTQNWLFAGFALAFLIKLPVFPFHGWMPDGYRAMPLPVLVFFSGVVSKVAAYGFLRIVLPVLPDAAADFQTLMYVLGVLSILYGSVQAFTQTNTKLILGYSSMAQLGFVLIGIFSLQEAGGQGAILHMLNHGLVVAPLFLIIVLLAERSGSEDIRDMGGIALRAPVFAALFLVASLATLAIPGSANFIGEFLILLGVFRDSVAIAVVAGLGVILAAVYMLRMFMRSMYNRAGRDVASREMSLRDGLVIAPLVAVIVAFALYPQVALRDGEPSVRDAVQAARTSAEGGGAPAGQVAEVAP